MFWHVFTSEAHVYVFPIVTGKGCQCNSLQPSLHLCFDSSNLKVSKTSRVRVWINGLSLFFSILRVHFCRYFLGLYFIRESVLDMGIYSYIYIYMCIDMDICWFPVKTGNTMNWEAVPKMNWDLAATWSRLPIMKVCLAWHVAVS